MIVQGDVPFIRAMIGPPLTIALQDRSWLALRDAGWMPPGYRRLGDPVQRIAPACGWACDGGGSTPSAGRPNAKRSVSID